MSESPFIIRFDSGTLLLDGADLHRKVPAHFRWDERVLRWRAPAWAYRHIIKELIRTKTAYEDRARAYDRFDFAAQLEATPRPYQQQAINEWLAHERCGVVILPTGAGCCDCAAMMWISLSRSSSLAVICSFSAIFSSSSATWTSFFAASR